MATSEDYLDNLLKAVLEGTSKSAKISEGEIKPPDLIVPENVMPENQVISAENGVGEDGIEEKSTIENRLTDDRAAEDKQEENEPEENILGDILPVSDAEPSIPESIIPKKGAGDAEAGQYDDSLSEAASPADGLRESIPEDNLDEKVLDGVLPEEKPSEEIFTLPKAADEQFKPERSGTPNKKVITLEELADMVDRLDETPEDEPEEAELSSAERKMPDGLNRNKMPFTDGNNMSEAVDLANSLEKAAETIPADSFGISDEMNPADSFGITEGLDLTDDMNLSGGTSGAISPEEADVLKLSDEAAQPENVSLENDLTFSDETNLSGEMAFPDEANLSGEMVFSGEANLSDEISFPDETNLSGDIAFPDEVNLSDDITFSDETNLPGEIASSAEVNLPGDLNDMASFDEMNLSDDMALPDEMNLSDGLGLPDEMNLSDDVTLPDEANQPDDFSDNADEKNSVPDDLNDIFAEMNTFSTEPEEGETVADKDFLADSIMGPDADEGIAADPSPEMDAAEDFMSLPELPSDFDDLPTEEETPQSLDDLLAADESSETDDLMALFGDAEMAEEGLNYGTPQKEADGPDLENMDINDLLTGMEDNDDLSEIKGLLDKADSNELVDDDDMMALLDGISEYGGNSEPEDNDDIMALLKGDEAEETSDKKKKKKKPAKKKKEAEEEQEIDLSQLDGLMPEEGKKKGFFGRIFSALTDADEEFEVVNNELQSITEENQEILNELAGEDKKAAKGKKGKKGKGKNKKGSEEEEEAEKGGRPGRKEEDEEEASEEKKKKPKKEKKKKSEEIEPVRREKRISPKKILMVAVFCISLTAALIAVGTFLPDYQERSEARSAYLDEDFATVYNLLYGKNLSKGDELLYNQSYVILQMERKLASYNNYKVMEMPAEALHALLQGVGRYETLSTEDLYEVQDRVNELYQNILELLSSEYGIAEAEARGILTLEEADYGQKIASLVFGAEYTGPEAMVENATPVLSEESLPSTESPEVLPTETEGTP